MQNNSCFGEKKRRMLLGRRHDGGIANGVWTRSEKQRELRGCTAGELHSSQGHEDQCGNPGLFSMAEQNLRVKCQTCGSHRVAAEARCRLHGRETTSGLQLRGRIRRQTRWSFCYPQPPFPSIQHMTFSCPDLDSCQTLSVF